MNLRNLLFIALVVLASPLKASSAFNTGYEYDHQLADLIKDSFSEGICDGFYVDEANSDGELLRICVPISYPNWFVVPRNSIAEFKELGTLTLKDDTNDSYEVQKALISFSSDYEQLNTILPAFQQILDEEFQDLVTSGDTNISTLRWRWKPPWTWSKCAKCKLGVTAFITGSVLAVTLYAGVTGPGALAIAKALIVEKYGLAAWEAVKSVIFSEGVGSIAGKICKANGKC